MYGRIQDTFSCKSVKANLSFTSLRMRGGIIHTHLYIHVIIIYYYLSNYFFMIKQSTVFSKIHKGQIKHSGNKAMLHICKVFSSKKIIRKLFL